MNMKLVQKGLLVLSLIVIGVVSANAQKTMYVMKNNAVVYETAVDDIDSIIFYNPAAEAGVVINGVRWATRNVDAAGTFAATPEAPGMFYQWNRNTAWAATGTVTGWDATNDTGATWAAANDPSPAGWRIPTLAEQQSLLDGSKVDKAWDDTKKGYTFTDKTSGASIFLPAVGYRNYSDGTLDTAGAIGYYWGSTPSESNASYAYYLSFVSFVSGYADWYFCFRSYGYSLRCVAE